MTREIKCGKCGKKLLTYDSDKQVIKYESPVKQCKKCGNRYIDPRCHEIAIEGVPRDTFKVSSYLVMLLMGGFICYRGYVMFNSYQLGTPDSMQWLLPVAILLVGGILFIGGIVEIVSILTGVKKRRFDKLRKESEARMMDQSYVDLLKDLGYRIEVNWFNHFE